MATVSQVAKASLQRILVQDSEASLDPSEYQDYIFALNNFMESLAADGLDLGWTTVSNLADTVTVPDGALRGIIDNVAIEVAPDYNGFVSQSLTFNASAGMKVLEKLGTTIIATEYPTTLPIGSGNESQYFQEDHFYPIADTNNILGPVT